MEHVYLIPLAILAPFGIAFLVRHILDRKRTSEWEGVAHRLGAEFSPRDDEGHTGFGFRLFDRGSGRRMKNHLQWESDGVRIHIADYRYVTHHSTGRGSASKSHVQTVCILEKAGSSHPPCLLRRERALVDWIGEKFGAQDIDFDGDPEFSRNFVLKGDETGTPGLFGPGLRNHFLQHRKGFRTFEMNGDAVMLDFGGKRKPEEYADLVAMAMPVLYLAGGSDQGW